MTDDTTADETAAETTAHETTTAEGSGRTDGQGYSGIGISCSGGGIRSAAFSLGALQSLDEAGVLRRADHLAAVSGGSFAASAYATASRYSDPDLLARRPAFAPGTPEETWVRNHCSYLTNGFIDTVRIAAIALAGLLANLALFTALLWTLARPLGWFYAWWQHELRVPADCKAGLQPSEAVDAGCYQQVDLTGTGPWALTAGLIIGAGLVLSLCVRMFHPRSWSLRQTLRRVALLLMAAGAALALVTVVLPELIAFTRNVLGGEPETGPVTTATGVGSSRAKGAANLWAIATVGGAVTVTAIVAQVAMTLRTFSSGARAARAAMGRLARLSRGLRRLVNLVVGAVIGPLALAAGALLILNEAAKTASPTSGELLWWSAMAVAAALMLLYGDVTSWSLHPFFKWRLARTFGVIRVPGGGPEGKAALPRYEDPLPLSALDPAEFPGSTPDRPAFPELHVCASMNVSDEGVTPPGQDSLSFVFGPRRVGYPGRVLISRMAPWWRRLLFPAQTELETVEYGPFEMATRDYETRVGERRSHDVTLPAVVAISAAGAAPTMGKMTQAPLRFLLALANIRLGVWLPNPAHLPPGGLFDRGRGRRIPVNPRQGRLLYEVVGRHRVRSTFLYVTDGGHYENLGLLELLRQRCTTIVCLDAAGGSTTSFSTLGEAVALASAELNVTITIDPSPIGVQADGVNACDHVTGEIRYPDGTRGTLVYGKAVVTAGSAWGVRAFAAKDPQFPVHPTSDQVFDGEMFDAYQALGRCVGARCAAVVTGEAPGGATAGHDGDGDGERAGDGDGATPTPVMARVTDVRAVAAAAAELY
jgi:Patatin-like phospholipase